MENIILTDFFTTKSDAKDFSARLSAIAGSIYEVGFNLEKELEEQFGIQKKDKFMVLLRENNIPLKSSFALNKFISQIQEIISSLPTASITLAIEPQEQVLKAISDWFLINIKKQILIEITIDKNIIAGAVIGYKGKRLDASIKPMFEKIYINLLKVQTA